MDTPNINLQYDAVFFDVLCEHDPLGTLPGERVESSTLIQCWVNQIAAFNPEEAGRKAERFLLETKEVRNIRVKRWRFSARNRQQKGVKPDGKVRT